MAPLAGPDAFFAAAGALDSSGFADKYRKKSVKSTTATNGSPAGSAKSGQLEHQAPSAKEGEDKHPPAATPRVVTENPYEAKIQTGSNTLDTITIPAFIDGREMATSTHPFEAIAPTTGIDRMNMLTRVHAFEHAILQQTRLLCSQIQAFQLKPEAHRSDISATAKHEHVETFSKTPQHISPDIEALAPPSPIPASTNTRQQNLPLYIKNLPPYIPTNLATTPLPHNPTNPLTFTHSFLLTHLGGSEYSPSLYYPATNLTALLTEDPTKRQQRLRKPKPEQPRRPEKRTYYLFDESVNPYVPTVPGEHGAALGLFYRDFEHGGVDGLYVDVPVFVALKENNRHLLPATGDGVNAVSGAMTPNGAAASLDHADYGSSNDNSSSINSDSSIGLKTSHDSAHPEKLYTYMGQYTQSRWSDRLSAPLASSTGTAIPPPTKAHWISLITSPLRPAWLSTALINRLLPPPTYTAPVPEVGDTVTTEVRAEIEGFFEELREWREEGQEMVRGLDEKEVGRLLEQADGAETPGLRWWWEYLECVGWDRGFVYALGSLKKEEKQQQQRQGVNDGEEVGGDEDGVNESGQGLGDGVGEEPPAGFGA